jgi:hypothetical protein
MLMFVPITAGFVALLIAITTGERGAAEPKRMSVTGAAAA